MAANHVAKRPLARLELMPPPPFSAVGSILEIWEANSKTIRVSDPTDNSDQAVARYFDLTTHRFILRYATERERSGWSIEINGDKPDFSITYAFLSRNFAFEFQKYITGYDPGLYEVSENIRCDASIKLKWRPGCEKYSGMGEVQLWVPFYGSSDENGSSTLWDTTSTTSAATTASALAPRVTHQSHGSTSAFVNEGRSPLIMMFLRETTEGRTMLRMNLRKVNWTRSLDRTGEIETLSFSHPDHPDKAFTARRFSVPKEDVKRWDACAMARKAKSKGIEEVTVAKLTLKIRRIPPPNGAPEPLSRLGQLEQQLNELREIVNGALRNARRIKHQIERGIIPNQIPAGGASGGGSESLHTPVSAQGPALSPLGTTSQAANPSPMVELVGDHRPRPSSGRTPTPTEMASLASGPSSPAHFYSHLDEKSSLNLSRYASPFPGSAANSSFRVPTIKPPSADIGATAVYLSTAHERNAPLEVPSTLVEETMGKLHEDPTSAPSDSSDDEDASAFTEFDQRVRRALHAEPSVRSAAESTIKRLHSLPGELRALVYDFPGFTFEGNPEVADAGDGGSLVSQSVTSSNTSGKLFRCPFNVANPREYWRGGCKGPGFPLSRLGDHLERYHLSYECPRCKKDCLDDDGLEQHECHMDNILRAEGATPPSPSRGISDLKLRKIKRILKPSKKGKIWDEERWFQMWEELFPGVQERPEPYFAPRAEMERPDLRRLEVVFGAMVDADGGGMGVNKAKTKLYLRAAMQAVEGRGFETWSPV